MAANGVNVSRDLLWILTNNHNSTVFKRAGIGKRFTTDPLNPKGLRTFKYSGSLQYRAANVQPHPSGSGVVLVHKKRVNHNSVGPSQVSVPLTKTAKKTNKVIKRFVNGNVYRRDLKATLLRRASAILLSQKVKQQKPKLGGKGKKD